MAASCQSPDFCIHCEPWSSLSPCCPGSPGRPDSTNAYKEQAGVGVGGMLRDNVLESKTTRVPKARNPRAPLQSQTRILYKEL